MHFPLMFVSSSFCHNPALQTVSNACLKSIKAQKSFVLFTFAISIRLCIINKLSNVENPLRNPA